MANKGVIIGDYLFIYLQNVMEISKERRNHWIMRFSLPVYQKQFQQDDNVPPSGCANML